MRPLLVVALSVTLAVGGGAAGSWLGWRTAGPLPTEAEAEAVATAAAPGVPVLAVQRRDDLFRQHDRFEEDDGAPFWLWGSHEYDPGLTGVLLSGGGEFPVTAARVRDGLAADGWRFSPVDRVGPADGVRGERDGIVVTLRPAFDGAVLDEARRDSDVALRFTRAEPAASLLLWSLGAAGGLLLGLRAGRLPGGTRAARTTAAWGLALLAPATLAGVWVRLGGEHPAWWPFMISGFRPAALLGAVLLALSAVLAYRRGRNPRVPVVDAGYELA